MEGWRTAGNNREMAEASTHIKASEGIDVCYGTVHIRQNLSCDAGLKSKAPLCASNNKIIW